MAWRVVATTILLLVVAAPAAAAPSPTPAHVYLRTKLGAYTVTITASKDRPGAQGSISVYLSRGNPSRDQQTHAYAFTVPAVAVSIDRTLDRAVVRARLGAYGAINVTAVGRGVAELVTPVRPCSGPGTTTRQATATGSVVLRLGALGTVRTRGAVHLDRLNRRGAVGCPAQTCRRSAATAVAGVTAGTTYLAVQSDDAGGTYVFATTSETVTRPAVSATHTRFARGGTLTAAPGAGADDRTVTLTGTGPASGSLTFAGSGAAAPQLGCAGQTLRRLSGRVTGSLQIPVDGVGVVAVTGDGTPTAPIGTYREVR